MVKENEIASAKITIIKDRRVNANVKNVDCNFANSDNRRRSRDKWTICRTSKSETFRLEAWKKKERGRKKWWNKCMSQFWELSTLGHKRHLTKSWFPDISILQKKLKMKSLQRARRKRQGEINRSMQLEEAGPWKEERQRKRRKIISEGVNEIPKERAGHPVGVSELPSRHRRHAARRRSRHHSFSLPVFVLSFRRPSHTQISHYYFLSFHFSFGIYLYIPKSSVEAIWWKFGSRLGH